MLRVLAAILSLTVAWHAVLGCEWHHAHQGSFWWHCGASHQHAEHRLGAQDGPEEDEQRAPGPCEENSCLFVRGEQVRTLDQFEEPAWAPVVVWSPLAVLPSPVTAPVLKTGPPLPAVPLHLRFSVLLI